MKSKIITGLIILAVIFIVITAGCIGGKPTYKIGLDAGLSPWEYIDHDKNPQGINIDIIEMIAENQNFNIEYVVPDASRWLEALDDGTMDTMGAIIITPEREEKYLLAEYPFDPTHFLVVARTDSGITLDDFLSGDASIAVTESTSYLTWIKNHFGEEKYNEMLSDGKIIITETADEIGLLVSSRKADTAISDAMALGNQLNVYQQLRFIGFVGEPHKLGYIFRKDDAELYNKFTEGFKNIANTPEFNSLIEKYNLQYTKDKYIVGIDEANSPWTYKGDDGKYTGFDVEMVEWIAEQNGFEVEFTPISWYTVINEIITGGIDMCASSMTINNNRYYYVSFSDPYYTSGISVAVRPDSQLTKSDFDKDGSKIATVYDTTYEDWLKDYFGEKEYSQRIKDKSIVLETDAGKVIEMFNSGKIDFIVGGEHQIQYMEDEGTAKSIMVEADYESFGIAMSNGDFALQELINNGLNNFESSGKKAELLEKYKL